MKNITEEKKSILLFKQKSQDFIVEEQLPFNLAGKGDAFFVFFEKRNKTTMEVVEHLCKTCNISRLTLWIAGLKDKTAITRQRISIYKSALKKIGWENFFLEKLSEVARVIKTDWHTRPLSMSDHIQNRFFIRLRATQALGEQNKQKLLDKIQSLFDKWFPNFYGIQRFGINGNNRKTWKEIIEWKTSIRETFEIKFKVQSYASWLFNEYVEQRLRKWLSPMDGEIVSYQDAFGIYNKKNNAIALIDNIRNTEFFYVAKTKWAEMPYQAKNMVVAAPVRWYNTMLSLWTTQAGDFQKAFMQKNNINPKTFALFKTNKIYGLYRSIWTYPRETKLRFDWDDILLEFSLESWSYASIIVDELLEVIK